MSDQRASDQYDPTSARGPVARYGALPMPTAPPLDELGHHFRQFAADHGARAPFTAHLARAIADAPDVVSILGAAPAEQQLPVLLLAAIHDQVLADTTCELAAWFPTVTAEPRPDPVTDALLAHCRDRAADLRAAVATRSVQTNEVGRCGLLLPALGIVADEVGPLAWLDVGTSGGLTLLLDRFEFGYRAGGLVGEVVDRVGGPSAVQIEVGTRGPVPVPARLPEIAARIGLDREPFDLADPARARWLRACVWPDQIDRFRRLDAAIALALADPVEVRSGDAVDDVAAAVDDVAGMSGNAQVVVTNTWVLGYLPLARRLAYVAELDRIGRERDLSWIFAESPEHAPGLPFDPSVAGSLTALVLVRWRRGERRVDHLGTAHPHGTWLHWHDAGPTP